VLVGAFGEVELVEEVAMCLATVASVTTSMAMAAFE
jgi:hypothetical protein